MSYWLVLTSQEIKKKKPGESDSSLSAESVTHKPRFLRGIIWLLSHRPKLQSLKLWTELEERRKPGEENRTERSSSPSTHSQSLHFSWGDPSIGVLELLTHKRQGPAARMVKEAQRYEPFMEGRLKYGASLWFNPQWSGSLAQEHRESHCILRCFFKTPPLKVEKFCTVRGYPGGLSRTGWTSQLQMQQRGRVLLSLGGIFHWLDWHDWGPCGIIKILLAASSYPTFHHRCSPCLEEPSVTNTPISIMPCWQNWIGTG